MLEADSARPRGLRDGAELDAGDVEALVASRACTIVGIHECFCEIAAKGAENSSRFALRRDGHWIATDIFAACTQARGRRVPQHRPTRDLIPPPTAGRLREDLIAGTIAADGVRPFDSNGRTVALEALLRSAADGRLAYGERPQVQAAVRAVVDAGLARLMLGPRGGFANAKLD